MLQESIERFKDLKVSLIESVIILDEASRDFNYLVERNRELKDQLRAKEAEAEAAAVEFLRYQSEAKKLLRDVSEMMQHRTPEEASFHETIPTEITLEDLNADIESKIASLDLMHEGDSGVIREFEQRQKRIDALRLKSEGVTQQLKDLDDAIAEVREKWEPELDNLVRQISDAFSYNFQKLGCAGQVSVFKGGDDISDPDSSTNDFDQWAIQIQVKFREEEQLSVLDNHRQSGGERAVSTIFYLMALQSLSASPFRVVDEINQGMDPRNERMVHERMVNIACQENTSQYFLITPKLLNGLKFDPRMAVHVINSGELMPDDYSKLGPGAVVKRKREVDAARG